MPWSYLGVTSFQNSVSISSAVDAARLRNILESITREIDMECQRTFRSLQAVRYYAAGRAHPYDLSSASEIDLARRLSVEDLLAVNSLKTDQDGDGVYETTWATTDYVLWPYNAAIDLEPYNAIDISLNGRYAFPVGIPKGIQLDAKWGYFEDLIASGATLNANITAGATSIVLATGGGALLQVLQTVLIDSEQVYITAITTDTLTVERGVNGTTAAAHLAAAPLSLYRYPQPIVEVARFAASRLFMDPHSPYAVADGADVAGAVGPIVARAFDAYDRAQRFRSGLGMAA